MKYTKEQEESIKTLDKNLLVSAGAGSGKTRILVERFIHILETERAAVDEIVAITFTNKAADEMRERIRKTAGERISSAKNERDRKKWLAIKHEVEGARISTFHGFCSRLLRENPLEARVDPAFRVMDEVQMTLMLNAAVQDIIFKSLEEGHERTGDLIMRYGKDGLTRLIKQAYELVRGSGMSFDDCLQLTLKSLHESLGMIDSAKRRVLSAGDSIARLDRKALPQKTREKVDEFERLWSVARNEIERMGAQSASSRSISTRELAKPLSGSMAKQASELKKAFIEELEELERLLYDGELVELTEGIFQLLYLCDKRYSMEKGKGLFLDYADLELKALELLSKNENIRESYRQRFKFVMVDEFQDTNFLQLQIVDLIAGGNLFLVGDYKQSIYRFRGAEVEVFVDSEENMSENGGKVIGLRTNFRSQQGILDFVNSLFQNYLPRYERLDAFRCDKNKEYFVECLMLDGGGSREDFRVEEATQLAKRIRQMVDNGEPLVYERDPEDPGKEYLRPVRYGDIAVLFRAMTNVKLYEYQFRRAGIPFHVVGGRGFLQKQEVFDCTNMLRALYNRYDAIALVGVLRSPFFGISDETLYWLSRDADVIQGLGCFDKEEFREKLKPRISAHQLMRLEEAHRILKKFRTLVLHLPVSELLRQVILETGYDKVALTKYDGEQIYANLEKLIELAAEFDSQEGGTLLEFLEYVELMMDEDMQESEAQIGSEDDDVVKLMTVHKGKGLEFPVVIIPEISRNIETGIKQVTFSRDHGLVFQGKDRDGNSIEGRVRTVVKEIESAKELEESVRVFYVATTRARDHLILSGEIPDKMSDGAQDFRSWMDVLISSLFEGELNVEEGIHVFCGQPIRIWKNIDWIVEGHKETSRPRHLIDMYPEVKALYSEEMALELMERDDITEDVLAMEKVASCNGPGRFSPTAIMSYTRCPRQYFFRFILRIPEPGFVGGIVSDESVTTSVMLDEAHGDMFTPSELGTIVHRVCENLRSEDELTDLLELVLFESGITFEELSVEERNEIDRLFDAWFSSDVYRMLKNAEVVRSELPFAISLGDSVIEGKMDKVFWSDMGAVNVVDFKTNKIGADDVPLMMKVYKLQADIYALAASTIFDVDEVRVFFSFLYPHVTEEKLFTKDDFTRLSEFLGDLLNDMAGRAEMCDFPKKRGNSCVWCSYRELCERF